MGYVLSAMIFILGTFIGGAIYGLNINTNSEGLNLEIDLLIALGFLIISFFVSYIMNGKYYSDIRNNEKISETKIIQRKIDKKDYEAGSGNMTTLSHNNPMKEFTRYDLIIENTKYRVDKILFDICADGDEVLFYYAPKSKYLLSIEKKIKPVYNPASADMVSVLSPNPTTEIVQLTKSKILPSHPKYAGSHP